MTTQPLEEAKAFDQEKAGAFSERMLAVLNHGSLALMISIGHRTGLLDAMASLPASSAAAIAEAAQLNERYVREWLGRWPAGGSWNTEPRRERFACRRSTRPC